MEDNQENKNLVKKEKNKNQSEIYQGVGAFVLEIVKIIILTFVIEWVKIKTLKLKALTLKIVCVNIENR